MSEPVDRWKPQPVAGPAGGSGTDADAGLGSGLGSDAGAGEGYDELPEELNAVGFVGPYLFPDNKRRRICAAIYLGVAVALLALWAARHTGGVMVNGGFLAGGVALIALAAYHYVAGYPLDVRDLDALTSASRTVGFPIGHASAQLGWRGLRSRPTWRILLYSAEEPPAKRGLVLVDGVDGSVVDHFVEDNPEDWSEFS
ncbi:MAG: hypothetical protein NVSMB12_09930 [Acidimicrobiales bacterium]